MTSKTLPTPSNGAGDIAKYVLAILLAVAGLVAFYWFENQWPTGVRALAVVAGLVLGALVFMVTAKGAQTREFLSESRFELRKVVWPTRQETTRTMWVVVAAVIIISLILAAFDWVIQLGVKFLLGNG
ncbi:MAG: preprotein translocase subunit SecE [Dokdonella sp.]|nr:preprotein translocase subunit SecE [Thermomonas sp.]